MRKTAPLTALPDPFLLTDRTRETAEREHPNFDIDKTKVKFERKAESLGWMYKSWQAAFLNYLDNCAKYGGAVFKSGASDPAWTAILEEARKYGFPAPTAEHPTPASYKTAFERWKAREKKDERVLEFRRA